MEFALLPLDKQPILLEPFLDLSHVVAVLFDVTGEDQDIIQVYDSRSVQEIAEYVIYQKLKGGGGIT